MKKAILIGVITLLPHTLLGQSKADTTKKYQPNPNKNYEFKFTATIEDINLIVFGLSLAKPKISETDLPYAKRQNLAKRVDDYIDSIKNQYTRQYKADSLKTIKKH